MNDNIYFSISPEEIKKIPFERYSKDFTFFVNGKSFKTSRIFADLLSPKIRKMHNTDATFSECHIKTAVQGNFVELIKSIENFEKIVISKSDLTKIHFYCEILKYLQNEDLCKIIDRIESDQTKALTDNNVIALLKKEQNLILSSKNNVLLPKTKKNFEYKIEYIAKNFRNINKKELKDLDIYILEKIFQNESLIIDCEDNLLAYFIELYSANPECSSLFKYILFENISDDKMKEFLQIFDPCDLNPMLWETVSKRFCHKKNKNITRYAVDVLEFQDLVDKGSIMKDGIMKFLTEKVNDNIHDKALIRITASSILDNKMDLHPRNLVDYDELNYYASGAEQGKKFILFDFKNYRVKLTHYSIKSYKLEKNGPHLKTWSIQTSSNNVTYSDIDKRDNSRELNENGITATFKVKSNNVNFARYVKVNLIENWKNNSRFYLSAIEFYGEIKLS